MEAPERTLEPTPYHVALRDYLQSHERPLWDWFASARAQADHTESLRTELLKNTYRLDPAAHPGLHDGVRDALARLDLTVPVTVYQAQGDHPPNGSLYFIPGEAHIVLTGPVLSLLNAEELKSFLGHELAHYRLWAQDGGVYHTTDRILSAAAADQRASVSHELSAHRLRLHTEIFADRAAMLVTGAIDPVITTLVKIATGLSHAGAAGYLQQAEEIFARGPVVTAGVSHPELFIRARALALWQEKGTAAGAAIAPMIEGIPTMDSLDLPAQTRLQKTTRRLLENLLQPKWFQTPPVLGHARLFFSDFQPAAVKDPTLADDPMLGVPTLHEYFSYVLLDFVTADRDLDEVPLARAFELSRQLDFEAAFEKIAAKELRLKARDIRRIRDETAALLSRAEGNP